MTHILELIERHRSRAQKRWEKGSQLRDAGATNYDAFMHGEAVGLTKAYNNCAQWIKASLHKEDETVTDCHQLEEELDAFIKSGKAIKEENCGTYTTTYIDPLKVARHFAKWGAEHLRK